MRTRGAVAVAAFAAFTAFVAAAACGGTSDVTIAGSDEGGAGAGDGGAGGGDGSSSGDASSGTDGRSGGDGSIAPGQDAAARKRVFVTSSLYDGNLAKAGGGTGADPGVDGADKLCNAAAAGAGLGGSWKAWVSSSSVAAKDRFADVGPWLLVDEHTLVFANKAALTSAPQHAIDMTEKKTTLSAASRGVYTGTIAAGTASGRTCTSWTLTVATGESGAGTIGDATSQTTEWTDVGVTNLACTTQEALYCFEQ